MMFEENRSFFSLYPLVALLSWCLSDFQNLDEDARHQSWAVLSKETQVQTFKEIIQVRYLYIKIQGKKE